MQHTNPGPSHHSNHLLVKNAHQELTHLPQDSFDFRILNALLENAPTQGGKNVIAEDIIVAAKDQEDGLHQLAEFYKTGLLLPMRAGGRTPQVSFHPSRDPEIKSEPNAIAADLEIAKRDQTLLKKYTLHRDGYRCVVTRNWDTSAPSKADEFDRLTGNVIKTQASHIIPFSLMSADTNKTLFKKCTIWKVIESFTDIRFKELNGDNINSLTNVMTLKTAVHEFFGDLTIWFEALPGSLHVYTVKKAESYFLREEVPEGIIVTFTSPGPEYPLPEPRYLAFHAAVAKVVHMAGMAEHLDDIIRKYEDIRVLSDDSGPEYLDGLLRVAQRCIATY